MVVVVVVMVMVVVVWAWEVNAWPDDGIRLSHRKSSGRSQRQPCSAYIHTHVRMGICEGLKPCMTCRAGWGGGEVCVHVDGQHLVSPFLKSFRNLSK